MTSLERIVQAPVADAPDIAAAAAELRIQAAL